MKAWMKNDGGGTHSLSLVQEPGSTYLGQVTPATGSAVAIKQSIVAFI